MGPTEGLEAELRTDLDTAVAAGLLPDHPTEWMAASMLGATLEVVTRLGSTSASETRVNEAGAFLGALFLGALEGLPKG